MCVGGGERWLGNFRDHEEKNLPQMGGGVKISFMNPWGGGGRKGHKYDFRFLFWHQNALASPQVPLFFIYFFFNL